MALECRVCDDWKHQIYLLSGLIHLAVVRTGIGWQGKVFKHCPWCGAKLVEESSAPQHTGESNV